MNRILLPLLVVGLLFACNTADAGIFGCKKKSKDCCCAPAPSCCPAPTCCQPAPRCCPPAPCCPQPAPCCAPAAPCCAAPVMVAPAAPCCTPVVATPAPCCPAPVATCCEPQKRRGLFRGRRLARRNQVATTY